MERSYKHDLKIRQRSKGKENPAQSVFEGRKKAWITQAKRSAVVFKDNTPYTFEHLVLSGWCYGEGY